MVEIKKASIDDSLIVSALIRNSFKRQAELLKITETDFPNYVAFESEHTAKQRILKTEVKILFAELIPIGTIGFYRKEKVGFIERLAVLPGYRGNHYGKLLLTIAEDELFASGCEEINISIVSSFKRLKEYYEDLGYRYKDKRNYPFLPFEVLYLRKLKKI